MDLEEIKKLIGQGEGVEIEFKPSFPTQHELAKTLCAFANTFGGIFFIGVSNKGEINGISSDKDNLMID